MSHAAFEDLFPNLQSGSYRSVGIHESDSTRVGTQIDWSSIALMASNVNHFNR